MEGLKDKLIESIDVNKANFEYIASKGYINGTLYVEIKRVMEEYLTENLKELMRTRSSQSMRRDVFGPRNEDC